MSSLAARALANLISVNFVNFVGRISVEPLGETQWASVTFNGARHRLLATLEGPGAVGAAADFLGRMPDLDLPLAGHVVADVALVAEERRDGGLYAALELEALTIEES